MELVCPGQRETERVKRGARPGLMEERLHTLHTLTEPPLPHTALRSIIIKVTATHNQEYQSKTKVPLQNSTTHTTWNDKIQVKA